MRNTNPDGPSIVRRFSQRIAKLLTPWQLLLLILNMVYIVQHMDAIVGLAAPEPLAHMYSANFYRATWLLTALDAGFWTAMPLRPEWLRHTMSLLFSVYYLVFANQADEKVRKIRATITVEQMRLSWEKNNTPILKFFAGLTRPSIKMIRKVVIERDNRAPIDVWVYFDGTLEQLAQQEAAVISFPGGGFVSCSPREHDDAHTHWAKKMGAPLISIDYKKAPEYNYPYALHECYDAYRAIMSTKGAALGLGMNKLRKCALVGDSAGGNYVAGVMIMLLENKSQPLPMPSGLVLIYPFLDFHITSWMSSDHLRLLRQESQGDLSTFTSKKHHERRKSVLSVKSDSPSSAEVDSRGTRVAMTSRVSFFQDRIISPDMMRAMALLYIGPHNKPDFHTDYLLSPIIAPQDILAQFPKTYFMCGEVDPFVDDTVIMAGRIREAKKAAIARRRDLAMSCGNDDHVALTLVRGTSHGFLQMRAFLPEARNSIARCRSWMSAILRDEPVRRSQEENLGDLTESTLWESKHLLSQDELLKNRQSSITRSIHKI